jgi:hypothetical protein
MISKSQVDLELSSYLFSVMLGFRKVSVMPMFEGERDVNNVAIFSKISKHLCLTA